MRLYGYRSPKLMSSFRRFREYSTFGGSFGGQVAQSFATCGRTVRSIENHEGNREGVMYPKFPSADPLFDGVHWCDTVDLTEYLREDMVLALPAHPRVRLGRV